MTLPPPPSSSLEVALVGAGRVGTAVAELLRRRGHTVAWVASRTESSARRAAATLGAPVADLDSPARGGRRPHLDARPARRDRRQHPAADVILIGAGDDAIAEVAARIAPLAGPGTVVCHFAGALGLEPLEPVVSAGAGACALHPVQSCPSVAAALERLPGSVWGVTAPPHLAAWAHELVAEVGGTPVDVAGPVRPLWHAAAVTASNGLVALLHTAESLLQAAGIEPALQVLGPLVEGTLANVWGRGPAEALTGPAVRGEAATIERHLEVIGATAPDLAEPYAAAAALILAAGRRAGKVEGRTEASVLALLNDARDT